MDDRNRPLAWTPAHADLGIVRATTEVFTVGDYRYSKLEDALAQARRVAK